MENTQPILAIACEKTSFRRFLILVLALHAVAILLDLRERKAAMDKTYFSQHQGVTQVRLQLSQAAPTPARVAPQVRSQKKQIKTAQPQLAGSSAPASIAQNRSQEDMGQNTVLAAYVNQIRDQVQKHKSYPALARRLKHQGIVVLEVTIRNDGLIENIHFIQKAHHSSLNQAALKALEQTRKFDPFPRELPQSQLVVSLPINFKLID